MSRVALSLLVVAALWVGGLTANRATLANPAKIWVVNSNVAFAVNNGSVSFTTADWRSAIYPLLGEMQSLGAGQVGQDATAIAQGGAPIILVQTDGSTSGVSLNGRGLTCNEIAPAFVTDVCGGAVLATPDPADNMVVYQVTGAGSHAINDTFVVTATQDAVTLDSEPLKIVGQAHDFVLNVVAGKTTIQSDASLCTRSSDITRPPYAGVIGTYTDITGNSLAGYGLYGGWSVSPNGVIQVAASYGMSLLQPDGVTIGDYNVVCGVNMGVGTLTVKTGFSEIPIVGVLTRQVAFTVTGTPASIALTASPGALHCDGSASSTVTATVTDSEGHLVVDNTPITFSVVALGIANPIQTVTVNGVASSTIVPFAGAPGDTVIVSSDGAMASIGVICLPPPAPSVAHASSSGSTTTIQAALNGAAPTTAYTIDLFSNPACTGGVSGGTFIGSFQKSSDVNGSLVLTSLVSVVVPPGGVIAATATDPYGYESAFSGCETVVPRQCPDDTLCNGYTDAQKIALGKDPFTYCTIMRADVNGDGQANILDLTALASQFLQTIPPGDPRYDQNNDGSINVLDLTAVASAFLKSVTACP